MDLRSTFVHGLVGLSFLTAVPTPLAAGRARPSDEHETYRREVDDFRRRGARLSPDDAARQWLDLVRRSDYQPLDTDIGEGPAYLSALPDPVAWPKIDALVDAGWEKGTHKGAAMKILMAVLEGRDRKAWNLLQIFRQNRDKSERLYGAELEQAVHMRDANAIQQALDDQELLRPRNASTYLPIPDLVPLVGVAKASKILKNLLFNVKAEIVSGWPFTMQEVGLETKTAALHIARSNVDRLAHPQWSLAASPDSGDLFERMYDRFPTQRLGIARGTPPDGSTYHDAAVACLVNLWSAGEVSRAKAFAMKHSHEMSPESFRVNGRDALVRRLAETGKLESFAGFLGDLAVNQANPDLTSLYLWFAENELPPSQIETTIRLYARTNGAQSSPTISRALVSALLRQGKYTEAAHELDRHPEILSNGAGGVGSRSLPRHVADVLKRPELAKPETSPPDAFTFASDAGEIRRLSPFGRAGTLLLEGRDLENEQLDQLAADAYRRALDINPEFVEAHYALGELEIRDGQDTEGAKEIDRALRSLPAESGAVDVGSFLFRYRSARADVIVRRRLAPLIAGGIRNPNVYLFAARMDSWSRGSKAAMSDNVKATQIDLNCFDAWIALAYNPNVSPRDRARAFLNCVRLGVADMPFGYLRLYDYPKVWRAIANLPSGPDPLPNHQRAPSRYRWIAADPLIAAVDSLLRMDL